MNIIDQNLTWSLETSIFTELEAVAAAAAAGEIDEAARLDTLDDRAEEAIDVKPAALETTGSTVGDAVDALLMPDSVRD